MSAPAQAARPPSRSPLRKPVPSSYHSPAPQPFHQQQQQQQRSDRLAPLTQITSNSRRSSVVASQTASAHKQTLQPSYTSQAPPQLQPQHPAQSSRTHAHSRTVSSATLPHSVPTPSTLPLRTTDSSPPSNPSPPSSRGTMSYQQQQQYANAQYPPMARRTLSNATTSTASTGGRKTSLGGNSLSRTTSSRSTSSNSYVALMRRQKATVWSDRAQVEDPRQAAQQRAAKMRAAMEVSGSHTHSLSAYGGSAGVRSKIRTHGVQKAQQYAPIAHPASGVPMRLSAREVEDDDSDDEHLGVRPANHARSGSGRSSTGSNGRLSSIYGPGTTTPPAGQRASVATTMTSAAVGSEIRPRADTQSTVRSDAEPTPVPGKFQSNGDYFGGTKSKASEEEDAEAGFGRVSGLPKRVQNLTLDEKSAEDLQRRGSVDERTTTMRGYGRLFVANPDLSD